MSRESFLHFALINYNFSPHSTTFLDDFFQHYGFPLPQQQYYWRTLCIYYEILVKMDVKLGALKCNLIAFP